MRILLSSSFTALTFCLCSYTQAYAETNPSLADLKNAKERIGEFNSNFLPPYKQIAEEIQIKDAPVQEIYKGIRFVKAPKCNLAKSALAQSYCKHMHFKDFKPKEIAIWKRYIDEAIALGGEPLFKILEKNGFRFVRSNLQGNLSKSESGEWKIDSKPAGGAFTKSQSVGYVEMPDSYFESPLFAKTVTFNDKKPCSYGAFSMLYAAAFAFDHDLKYSYSPEFIALSPYSEKTANNPLALPADIQEGLDEIRTQAISESQECAGDYWDNKESMENLNIAVPCREQVELKHHNDGLKFGFANWQFRENPEDFFAMTLISTLIEPTTTPQLNPSVVAYVKSALEQESAKHKDN